MGEVTRFRGPTGQASTFPFFFHFSPNAFTASRIRKHPTWHRATRPAASDASLPSAQSASAHRPSRHDAVTAQRPQLCVPLPARLRPRPSGLALSQSHSSPVRPLTSLRRRNAAIADLAVADLALCSASLHRRRRRQIEPAAGSPSPRRPGTENRSGAPSGLADRRPLRLPLRPPPSRRWIEIISAPFGLADHKSVPPPSALASPDRDWVVLLDTPPSGSRGSHWRSRDKDSLRWHLGYLQGATNE
ncbi:hypothetical protein Taro_014622 [Colocasia esculenta]|uniref:Uncharacterized protein n=1 Tax=Colocasia esculenta TaxID=4460 RepID=A0A843UIN8_COLES|nr:hypothetical protein [Colocasia esculenta]